ncbi:MAG: hypothetical protein ACLR8Y_11495 [Alistipes indistinctus]
MKQFVSFMLCLLAFSAASAQVTTSSMSGHVQDEQGAPVVGALVLATHTPQAPSIPPLWTVPAITAL